MTRDERTAARQARIEQRRNELAAFKTKTIQAPPPQQRLSRNQTPDAEAPCGCTRSRG